MHEKHSFTCHTGKRLHEGSGAHKTMPASVERDVLVVESITHPRDRNKAVTN